MIGISHYIESICDDYGRFRRLKGFRCSHDERGQPKFISGSNAVIFKGTYAGKKVAIKCYKETDGKRGERYREITQYFEKNPGNCLVGFEYLENELYLFDNGGEGGFYPVLVSEWQEGCSLGRWLLALCGKKDRRAIARMARKFDDLFLWLLHREWAHGDLKPDNIIVTGTGGIRLIDYDNAFVPALAGKRSPGVGTPGFQHPARSVNDYDRHLDDYSIALISTALHALSEFPEWYTERDAESHLLFAPEVAVRGNCEKLNRIREHWLNSGQTGLYRLAGLLESPVPEIAGLSDTMEQLAGRPFSGASGQDMNAGSPELYRENGLYGYRTQCGRKITEAVYDDAEPFREKLAVVRIGGKCLYVNAKGEKQIDASAYARAESFSEGLAAVRRGNRWGYLDKQGDLAIPAQFEQCHPFKEQLAAVKINGKWGFVGTDGRISIEAVFDSASGFREGIAPVRINGLYGCIDRCGNWQAKPRYTFVSGFRNGFATAEINGRSIRLVKEGDKIVEISS